MIDLSELISHFVKWYDNDPHSRNEDYFIHTITHGNLSKMPRNEFIQFFYNFVAEGGKIQSGGDRQKNRFKETIESSFESFNNFALEPFSSTFDLTNWLNRVNEFKHFGFGSATIYLNRIDKNKYCIVNNKTQDALKELGFHLSTDMVKCYFEVNEAQKSLIKQYPVLSNFYKADALNHFIIAVEEGEETDGKNENVRLLVT